MRIKLVSCLLSCLAVNYSSALFINLDKYYRHEKLQKNIYVRLLHKDWKPLGPSAATDDVLDEYKWDVEEAYKALRYSKWTYENANVRDAASFFKSKNYDKSQESIVVIHPILASGNAPFVKTTVNALAMRNLHKKYNIFAVDMPWNNPQMILSIILLAFGKQTHFEPMAKAVSSFLVDGIDAKLISPEQIHLIGWSYSGQLVGYVARYIKRKYNKRIATIMALDPFYKFHNRDLFHVSRDDAQVVHIHHTNSMVTGTRERLGTADFVYNNGIIQPECRWSNVWKNTIKEPNSCSHMKVVQRFWYVILYPAKFVAVKCPTWRSLNYCLCEGNDQVNMRYPIPKGSKVEGLFYLRTLGVKPYGVGKWGATCSSEKWLYFEN